MIGFVELARAAAAAHEARREVPLALATLVQVDGSSYRQPGARLLVDAEGRVLAGAISGGCLEADVAARAADVCASGKAVRLRYDLRTDLETIWGFGAACDGVAHLLLEPLTDWRWLHQVEAIRGRRQGGAVVTLLDSQGSGATCLVRDGAVPDTWRSVHPSSAQLSLDDLVPLADAASRTGHPLLHDVSGELTVFVEPIVPCIALQLIGAGRGAEEFAQLATTLGWQVTVLDHRPAVLEALVLPAGVQRRAVRSLEGVQAALDTVPRDARTAFALLSHIFEVDAAWLRAVLPLPVGYVGVLGSRTRAEQLLDRVRPELAERGTPLTARQLQKLYAPIGLDLGGESPVSIALAAVAEIEAVVHARPGGFLRERRSPIHTRTPTPRVADRPPTAALIEGPLQCDLPESPAS